LREKESEATVYVHQASSSGLRLSTIPSPIECATEKCNYYYLKVTEMILTIIIFS